MRQFLQLIREIHTVSPLFAGHSKWANIRHIKAAKDGQKSIQFQKYSRQIRLAIQGKLPVPPNFISNPFVVFPEGKSTNPALNSQLKSVIEIAVKNSMPNANIQNVIKKYNKADAELKRVVLEIKVLNKIYAVAVIFTDNLLFSKNQISTILRKSSAAFSDCKKLFDETGLIEVIGPENPGGDLLEQGTDAAIECGAEEVDVIEESSRRLLFVCNPQYVFVVNKKLNELGYSVEGTDTTFVPKVGTTLSPPKDNDLTDLSLQSTVVVSEAERAAYKLFYEKLKAFDGIESIFDNMEPEEE